MATLSNEPVSAGTVRRKIPTISDIFPRDTSKNVLNACYVTNTPFGAASQAHHERHERT